MNWLEEELKYQQQKCFYFLFTIIQENIAIFDITLGSHDAYFKIE